MNHHTTCCILQSQRRTTQIPVTGSIRIRHTPRGRQRVRQSDLYGCILINLHNTKHIMNYSFTHSFILLDTVQIVIAHWWPLVGACGKRTAIHMHNIWEWSVGKIDVHISIMPTSLRPSSGPRLCLNQKQKTLQTIYQH